MKTTLLSIIFLASNALTAQIITNDFDEATGNNSYSGISDNNWCNTATGLGISENAGAEFLASANGNSSGFFDDLGITKELGGVIQNHPYRVSFYIAVYNDGGSPLVGVEYADFSILRLGGPNGTIVWDSVPTPTVYGEWVEWSGTYTPDPTDIGQQFTFECLFDLHALHAIGIDGPFTMHHYALGLEEEVATTESKELIMLVDMMGRQTEYRPNVPLIYVYSDGTRERKMGIE